MEIFTLVGQQAPIASLGIEQEGTGHEQEDT